MEVLLKACAVAGVGMFAAVSIKRTVPEMSVLVTLVCVSVLAFMTTDIIHSAIDFINELAQKAGLVDGLMRPLIKCLGISIVTRIACDVCREGGVSSLATYIELLGGVIAILIAAPMMMGILDSILA